MRYIVLSTYARMRRFLNVGWSAILSGGGVSGTTGLSFLTRFAECRGGGGGVSGTTIFGLPVAPPQVVVIRG